MTLTAGYDRFPYKRSPLSSSSRSTGSYGEYVAIPRLRMFPVPMVSPMAIPRPRVPTVTMVSLVLFRTNHRKAQVVVALGTNIDETVVNIGVLLPL